MPVLGRNSDINYTINDSGGIPEVWDIPLNLNPRKVPSPSLDSPGGKFELFCIFVCALGVTIGFTATLSCVNYLTAIFDSKDIFLYLCCCIYAPTLPVVLFQLNCDQPLDRRWGSRRTYYWRVILALIIQIGCILYLPFSSGFNPDYEGKRSYLELVIPVTVIGVETSILHGVFFQLVSFIRFKKKGSGAAAFTFGYQGSGFLSLAITLACGGIGTDPKAIEIDIFFSLVAAVQFLGLICFSLMAWKSVPYKQGMDRRDEEMKWLGFKEKVEKKKMRTASTVTKMFSHGRELLNSPLLESYDKQYSVMDNMESSRCSVDESVRSDSHSMLSSYYTFNEAGSDVLIKDADIDIQVFNELMDIVDSMESASKTFVFERIWPCIFGLFLNIFGSIFLMPFYPYIPGNSSLPQILFYTKLFSDTLSRPLTMLIPEPKSKYWYLLMTFLRLAIFLPVFFLYIYDLLGVQNDYFIIFMVSLFSLTSGLFGTFGYQLAPPLLEHQNGKLVAANYMNLSFNSGCVMALVVSFTIIHTVNLD